MVTDSLKPGYKQTEVGVIPEDWDVKRLGEIGEFKNGINKSNEDFGFGSPFVNLMDVFGRTKIENNLNFGLINSSEVEKKLYNLMKGDVIFIRSSVKPCGVGLTCVIVNNLPGTVFSGFLIRFRDKGSLTDDYKQHYFYNEKFRTNLISNSTVSANTNINQEALKKLIIAFPKNKLEQSAIAQVLSDTDVLIESLNTLITKKKNIKQGTMQQLLTGKKRLSGFKGEWGEKRLGDLAEMSSGGTPLTTNNSYYGGKIPWVVIADMTNIQKYLYQTAKTITEEGLKNSSAKLFKKGTLLFAMYASIGKCAIAKIDSACNQAILGITSKNIDTEFLYYHLSFNEQKFLQMGQTGTQNNLNKEIVQNLKVPYPSLDEQSAIAKVLSDMDAEIEELEQKRDKYKLLKAGMMQQLLTGRIRLSC